MKSYPAREAKANAGYGEIHLPKDRCVLNSPHGTVGSIEGISPGADARSVGGRFFVRHVDPFRRPRAKRQANAYQGYGLRMRNAADWRGHRPTLSKILPRRDAFHPVRYRSRVPLSVGR